MRLIRWNIRFFHANFFEATDSNERFSHPVFHAFNESGHGNEAGDAKNDAEHREQRTKLVRPDFLEPDRNGVEKVHDGVATGTTRSSPASFASTCLAILPSRISIFRGVTAAISGSCVTSAIVRPSWLSRRKSERIASPVCESRLPVGSSAKTIFGLLTKARAIATRCCCPPESCIGRCFDRFCRSTISSAFIARWRRSRPEIPL